MTRIVKISRPPEAPVADAAAIADPQPVPPPHAPLAPREIGGRTGPDPTRYGDWEMRGRCIDF